MARRLAASWPLAAWTSRQVLLLGLGFIVGIAIRVWLLPTPGYYPDINQFVVWIRHISENGLSSAYDQQLSFGPVMVYIWSLMGALDPALTSGLSSSDLGVRVAMKLPATLADFGLAAAVAFALRARPIWAIAGATGLLVVPTTSLVSAWWGQYDSIFALLVLVAFLLAVRGRDAFAAVAVTAALMTKPQAAPLVIPFAAWFIARWDVGGLVRLAAIGALTTLLLWLPFVAEDGPAKYLAGLAQYQDARYAKLSLNAWNWWWMVEDVMANGQEVADGGAFLGPLSYRMTGYLITGSLLLGIGYGVWRRPTPRILAIGLAAAALVAFSFLTTMHERYGYAAVILLALLADDRRVRWFALAVGVVTSLNIIAAAGIRYLPRIVSIDDLNGYAASTLTVAVALALVWELFRPEGEAQRGVAANELAESAGGASPPGTSAGSEAAISGA